jgi:hypothetical protein
MSLKTGLRLSSAIAGTVCLVVLAIVVPQHLWTTDGVVSALVLSLSLASPAFLTITAHRPDTAEAVRIWLIGPIGKLWLLLLLVAATALRTTFLGWHRASWAVCVVWCGLCLAGLIILSASARIVSGASSQTKPANTDSRNRWAQQLLEMRSQIAGETERSSIERLAERIRFAANETGHEPEENREIETLLGELKGSLENPDEMVNLLHSTEALLERREQTLRASRTRA